VAQSAGEFEELRQFRCGGQDDLLGLKVS